MSIFLFESLHYFLNGVCTETTPDCEKRKAGYAATCSHLNVAETQIEEHILFVMFKVIKDIVILVELISSFIANIRPILELMSVQDLC